MFLDKNEERMLAGEYGPEVGKAMEFLVKIGDAFDAKKMVNIYSAHPYGPGVLDWIYNEEEQELLLKRAREGLKVNAFSTCHVGLPDFEEREAQNYSDEYEKRILRLIEIYRELGIALTSTCAPYLVGNIVPKGQHIAWTESSAWIWANSVFGARGNREGMGAYYSALTGKTPEFGMHLDEYRKATLLVDVKASLKSASDFGALGYFTGRQTDKLWEIPALTGIKSVTTEGLKQFCGGTSSSGANAMFHMVGITPEAPTLEAAFQSDKPGERITFTEEDLKKEYELLSTAEEDDVDMVLFGCPHASLREVGQIASILKGKKVHENVRLWVQCADTTKFMAKKLGYTDIIRKAGGCVLCGVCPLLGLFGVFPWVKEKFTLATNSSKQSHYAQECYGRQDISPGEGCKIWYGTTEKCINAALRGKW
jgi:predicted aconitase